MTCVTSLLVAFLSLCHGSVLVSPELAASFSDGPPKIFRSVAFKNSSPSEVVASVRSSLAGTLRFEEQIDYAAALYASGRILESAIVYELSVRLADQQEDRVFALMMTGQTLMDAASISDDLEKAEMYIYAGQVFNAASRLAPDSKEAAAMRVAAWNKAGDRLELASASSDLRRLGVHEEGEEVSLTAAAVIVASVYAATMTTYTVYVLVSDLTQEEKMSRLRNATVLSAFVASKAAVPRLIN